MWGRSQLALIRNLPTAGAYKNDGVNGEKETFLNFN